MNEEAVKALKGKITSVRVEYSRSAEVTDGDWRKSGLAIEASVTQDDSVKDVVLAAQSYAEAFVNKVLGPAAEAIRAQVSIPSVFVAPQDMPANATITFAPTVGQAPSKSEPTRTKVDDDGNEYEYVKVSSLTVQFTPQGKKVGKIKGGHFTKFGATVWPEVLKTVGVDLDSLEAGEHQLPALAGKTAVCLMKISDKTGKPYPEKVVEFVE